MFTRDDWLEYALKGRASEAGKTELLRQYLAGHPEERRKLAELRRDLYRMDVQLPRLQLGEVLAGDIQRLVRDWCARRVGLKPSRSFFREGRLVFWAGLALMAYGLVLYFLKS